MAKRILIENFPNPEKIDAMVSALSAMQPEPTNTLTSLVDRLKTGIYNAKKSGVGWDKIASYIKQETGVDVSATSVSQAYGILDRDSKNKARSKDEPSYTKLKTMYNAALKFLSDHNLKNEFEEQLKIKRKAKDNQDECTEDAK